MNLLSLFGQTSNDYYRDLYSTDSSLYNTTTNTQMSDAAAAGVAIGMLVFLAIAFIVIYVIASFLLSRIFKKAGVEPWKAWVPIYNNWILLELGDQKGFWAVLAIIPFVGIVSSVFMIISQYNIGLKFGKEGWFVLLAIFIPVVWLAWLAFDKSTWNSLAGPTAPATGPTLPPQGPTPPASTPPAAM